MTQEEEREQAYNVAQTVAFCADHPTVEVPAVSELIKRVRSSARAAALVSFQSAARALLAKCEECRNTDPGAEPWDDLCEAESVLRTQLEAL